jgi:hypothetical protein
VIEGIRQSMTISTTDFPEQLSGSEHNAYATGITAVAEGTSHASATEETGASGEGGPGVTDASVGLITVVEDGTSQASATGETEACGERGAGLAGSGFARNTPRTYVYVHTLLLCSALEFGVVCIRCLFCAPLTWTALSLSSVFCFFCFTSSCPLAAGERRGFPLPVWTISLEVSCMALREIRETFARC